MIIASAAALNKAFPEFMKKPLAEEHQFVKIVEKGRRLYERASHEYETIKNAWEEESKARVYYDNNLKPMVQKKLQATTETDFSFQFDDIFNIAFGLLEGATSAIPTSTLNFQCGKNVTNARLWTEAAGTSFAAADDKAGVSYIYKVLQIADDITINCWLGIKASAAVDTAELLTMDGIPTNLLYNAGFMFTDILNLVNYNVLSTDPYWYYVAYNAGDFLVRFIYRDDS